MYLGDSKACTGFDQTQLFNKYFYSVFTHSSYDSLSTDNLQVPNLSLSTVNITPLDVFQALSSLDPSKASSNDSISPALLKNCAGSLTIPVHYLLTLSLGTQSLPLEWRTHCIVPVFKSGDRALINNYRPISLLSVISKVLEKIVYQNLFDFLYSRLSIYQFGFIPRQSCLQQLLSFTHELYLAKSLHHDADVIYLDYKKAFDSVVHTKLLYKLWEYGINDNLWNWIRAYLTGRRQCVRVNDTTSEFLPGISGVPQGSLLGPLFYIIFINDMFDSFQAARPFTFADDTKLLLTIHNSSDHNRLQKDLDELSQWNSLWNLSLNPSKCHHIHYHFSNTVHDIHNQYFINNNSIPSQLQTKDLGITFTSNLQWTMHYKSIISKAYKMFHLLRRTFNCPLAPARKHLYLALVRSYLVYCSPLWRPYLIKDIENFERLQRRATKFILNNYHLDYKSRLSQCCML